MNEPQPEHARVVEQYAMFTLSGLRAWRTATLRGCMHILVFAPGSTKIKYAIGRCLGFELVQTLP